MQPILNAFRRLLKNEDLYPARAKTQAEQVKQIQEKLISTGHTIAYDWASVDVNVRKLYRDPANREHKNIVAPKMLKAAASADVFILIDEPGLRGHT